MFTNIIVDPAMSVSRVWEWVRGCSPLRRKDAKMREAFAKPLRLSDFAVNYADLTIILHTKDYAHTFVDLVIC